VKLHKSLSPRIILSGGGTGGHLYPALAIAEALEKILPEIKILFVGANGKIEMDKVPEAGYNIVGLDIRGFHRSLNWENLKFPFRLIKAYLKSRSILKKFKPHAVVGVGGYASGPLLLAAGHLGIPSLIQEQNSFPGKTNLYLSKKASILAVAYPHMDRFFDPKKIVLTGNPIRSKVLGSKIPRDESIRFFGLDPALPVILVLGGSGGARSLNEAIIHGLADLERNQIQVLWQTGKVYYEPIREKIQSIYKIRETPFIKILPFLDDMSKAYGASDLVISRAGAGTISELTLVGKPCILVPSPNVAEDHQTKNASSLVENKAAVLVKDIDALDHLIPRAIEILRDSTRLEELSRNILLMGHPQAAEKIAALVLDLALNYKELNSGSA
jgi:UDP-N-acetylglucosamine--N-acetylmuramyl-(pentapeptide) pyrophosphoryl-undecaprenol N-acetylglucosamine transferase